MAHEHEGKMKFNFANIRVLDDGTFILEEHFMSRSKDGVGKGEHLEYSYENVSDLLKDLGEDLGEFAGKKSEDDDDDSPKMSLKKMVKGGKDDEDE